MGFGLIENGSPGDEIWLDRSFDGGISWVDNSRLGYKLIPQDSTTTQTLMYNVDDPATRGIGALRVCGKAGDRVEIACTPWVRSRVNADSPIDAAATGLMQFYNQDGLWTSTGWWNAGNCLTALIDFSRETGSSVYRYAIESTLEKNLEAHFGNFTNDYIDDTLWWGLAWLDAYTLTGDSKYLHLAQIDADYSWGFKDDVCGGGIWWSIERGYKNAIPNELFIKLAAGLHNALPGDTKYLGQAIEIWDWFRASGMINGENLINDGLSDACAPQGDTWSYNQGVILGGLLELHKATGEGIYIEEARRIVDAVIASPNLNDGNGILKEDLCDDCGGDVPSFKGSFVRNLGELDRFLPGRPYLPYLTKQAESLYANSRNEMDHYGAKWAGPFDTADGARQHSALEAFTAAHVQ
jgi:predicted alpha-1,6-mannanase (GH76 family)